MKACSNCGAEMADDARFCSQCGRSVESARQPANWLLLAGAVAGAFTALIVGYVLSFVALKAFLAIAGRGMVDPQGFAVLDRLAPRLAGLLYVSSHHVTLNGFAGGGVFLSILLPITTWVIFPSVSIISGGMVSAVISKASGKRDILAASLASTALYILLLVFFRPLFAVNTLALNQVELGGVRTAFPTVVLAPSVRSLFLDGGLSSLILFALGSYAYAAGVNKSSIKRFLIGLGRLPSWASGAILAVLAGFAVVSVILLLGSIVLFFKGSSSAGSGLILAGPAVTGLIYYLLHAVTLTAANTAGYAGSAASHLYTLSLFDGLKELMQFPGESWRVLSSKSLSPAFWLGILIPAAAIILGAYVNYKNRDHGEKRLLFALKMSLVYTFILLVGISFFSFRMNAADAVPGIAGVSRMSLSIAPGTWPTVVFGLAFGFVFSLIGSFLAGRGQDNAE